MAVLIVFGGLPASGKSSIARELAREIGATWLRIDSIEQAIRNSGVVSGSIDDVGYRAAYALAEDNLRLGRDVVGDSVNGWPMTRNAWRDVARRTCVPIIEIETVCLDAVEHRRRVESRVADIPGLTLPAWQEVIDRDYEPWDREHLRIDTSAHSIVASVKLICAALAKFGITERPATM